MYRDSFDTLAREAEGLRADNERLRAELATIQRIARPRRAARIVGLGATLALLAGAVASTTGYAHASLDAQTRTKLDEACWEKLDATKHELDRVSSRSAGPFDDRVLRAALEDCRRRWGDSAVHECPTLLDARHDGRLPWDTCTCQ